MKPEHRNKPMAEVISAFLAIPAVAEALTVWFNNKDDSIVEFKPVFPPAALVAGTWIVDTSNWISTPRRIGAFEKIGPESMMQFTDGTEMLVSHMLAQPWFRPARCIQFTMELDALPMRCPAQEDSGYYDDYSAAEDNFIDRHGISSRIF